MRSAEAMGLRRRSPTISAGSAAVMAALLVGVAALVALGVSGDPYYGNIAILTFLSVVLGVTIRPLLVAGEASFCHGSFYALGAYTVGILSVNHGVSVWLGLPLGGLVAMIGALVIGIPSLRTTGSYFFLMTFAFLVITSSLFEYFQGLTGGFSGISGIPAPAGVAGITGFFFVAMGLALLTIGIFWAFDRARWGLELRALGDSRALAQAAGASRLGNMLAAFAVGAFFAGMAGGIYASYITFISPASFTFWLSVYVLTYVILGGSRYLAGAIVGTVVLAILQIVLNWSEAYLGIFTAAAMLLILLIAPRGLVTHAVELGGRLKRRAPSTDGSRVDAAAVRPGVPRPASSPDRLQGGPTPRSNGVSPRGAELLQVEGVSKRFDGVHALEDVSFSVSEGEVFGVIGPNGAGKTTLFNVISGFDRPSGGSVRFAGREIVGLAPHRIVRLGLTRTFQASSVCQTLTAFENVLLGSRGRKGGALRHALLPVRRDRAASKRASELIELFGLQPWRDLAASEMPYGARKRLGVAIAMATEPRALCLDEPMAGLSEPEAEDMARVLRLVREERRVTIALIEHRVPVVLALCDRIIALDFGRQLATGTPEQVAADPAVVEAYLGTPEEVAAHA